MLVLYDYDSNAILTEPLRNREGTEILRGYAKLHTYLVSKGFNPRTHWLYNESSVAFKIFNTKNHVEYQLVPPYMHHCNSAERAIRTWKNNFVAGLCSTDDKFPIHLWDRLLQQSTFALNILLPSRRNPQVSAYTILEGQFDFIKTPMAPPGTKVLLHDKTVQIKSWNPHLSEGWYLGPALEHYRCCRVYTNKTRAKRIMDTVNFFTKDHITVSIPYQCGRPSH